MQRMNIEDFSFLLSEQGQAFLQETAVTPITPHNHLQIASQLRKQLPPARAQAVLETLVLRQRGAVKFSRAAQMYFTRAALEQASSEQVARHRARRFMRAGVKSVADLGCGIGGDAIALAEYAEVIGIDRDGLRLRMARQNLKVYGRSPNFHPLQADLLDLPPFSVDALFFDPARRDRHGKRIFSVHKYQPPLSLLDGWREMVTATAVKISPGVDYAELPLDAELEFISLNGEVKEGVLWFGELRDGNGRRATLLPGGHTLTKSETQIQDVEISDPKTYLYEPDGAVIRAHLVQELAHQLDATQIDSQIAYLTTDQLHHTPFARCFEVEATFPFQLKRLRAYLRENQIGNVTIKKRGSPLDPDILRRQLRLKGARSGILFLTRVKDVPTVIIGRTTP